MGGTLARCAATDLGIQWFCWVLAAALRTEKFYDLAGSGTFILLTHLSRVWGGAGHARQKVQAGLVTAWGLRLGTFLFLRILKDGHDRRFDHVRDSPGTFFVYWTVQAVWVFITLLPTLMLNTERRNVPLGARDYIGWAVWSLGFATETIADRQKWLFKSNPDNAGKFIRSGLWAYSRHPNYAGEILQWAGLWLSASSVMRGPQHLSVASPLFVWFLLRHVSGVPILEKQAAKRWGSEPAFQDYVQNTPLLWPRPAL
uniref:Si:ch211-210c8.6 n=2 Tax=Kryptolebias marmoratus TaxID=37003 RepID=A0A3Q2ZUC4_KRYMA